MEVEETVAPTKVKTKAKGKAKAESKPKPIETVDIPDSGDERAAAVRRPRAQKAKASSPPALASDPHINALERENERLKRQLEQVRSRTLWNQTWLTMRRRSSLRSARVIYTTRSISSRRAKRLKKRTSRLKSRSYTHFWQVNLSMYTLCYTNAEPLL